MIHGFKQIWQNCLSGADDAGSSNSVQGKHQFGHLELPRGFFRYDNAFLLPYTNGRFPSVLKF